MLGVAISLTDSKARSATPVSVSKTTPTKSLAPVSKTPDLPDLDFGEVSKLVWEGLFRVSKFCLSRHVFVLSFTLALYELVSHPPYPLLLTIVKPAHVCLPEEYNSCHFPETKDSGEVCARSHQQRKPKAPKNLPGRRSGAPRTLLSSLSKLIHAAITPQQSLFTYAPCFSESTVAVTPCSAFTWTVIHHAAHRGSFAHFVHILTCNSRLNYYNIESILR